MSLQIGRNGREIPGQIHALGRCFRFPRGHGFYQSVLSLTLELLERQTHCLLEDVYRPAFDLSANTWWIPSLTQAEQGEVRQEYQTPGCAELLTGRAQDNHRQCLLQASILLSLCSQQHEMMEEILIWHSGARPLVLTIGASLSALSRSTFLSLSFSILQMGT